MRNNSLTTINWALVPVEDHEEQLKEWGILPNDSVTMNTTGIIMTYEEIPTIVLAFSIVFHVLAMTLKVFIVSYERFEMDSMKRGLKNQLISSQMIWTFLLSLTMLMRITITLCSINNFAGFQILLEYVRIACLMAIPLIGIEISLFEFYCKFVLKRVPESDHDILAIWLSVVNLILTLYFGFIQFYGKIGFNLTGDYPIEAQQPRQVSFSLIISNGLSILFKL